MSDARQYTAIVIVLLIMPDSGYYAARQRRVYSRNQTMGHTGP
jgi:hypothetical protein